MRCCQLTLHGPDSIKLATTGGIGFFLAHLGLQTAEGIGLVVTDVATGVTLGGCPAQNRTYAFYDGLSADVRLRYKKKCRGVHRSAVCYAL